MVKTITSPDTLYYDSARSLTWDDFMKKGTGGFEPAYAYMVLAPQYIKQQNGYQVIVRACFIKSKSRVWPGKATPAALTHVQFYFELADLVAQKVNKQYQDNNCGFIPNDSFAKGTMRKRIEQACIRLNEMIIITLDNYELDTNYGANAVREAWYKATLRKYYSIK